MVAYVKYWAGMRPHSSQQNTAHSYQSQMNICIEDVNMLIQLRPCYIQCCDQHSFRLFLATLRIGLWQQPRFSCAWIPVCMFGACNAHVGFRHQLKFGFMMLLAELELRSWGPGNETGQQLGGLGMTLVSSWGAWEWDWSAMLSVCIAWLIISEFLLPPFGTN